MFKLQRHTETTHDPDNKEIKHTTYSFSLDFDAFMDIFLLVAIVVLIVNCCGCNRKAQSDDSEVLVFLMTVCPEKNINDIIRQGQIEYDKETVKEMVDAEFNDSQLQPQQKLNLLLNANTLGFINENLFLQKLEEFNNDKDFAEALKKDADRITEQKKDANETIGKNQPY